MKLLKSNYRLSLFSALIFFIFISTGIFAQQVVPEQDVFTLEEKARLIDYYWNRSRNAAYAGDYDKAVEEARNIYEIDPNNKEVQVFIAKMLKREKVHNLQRDFVSRADAFIRKQEKMSRFGEVAMVKEKENVTTDKSDYLPNGNLRNTKEKIKAAKAKNKKVTANISKDDYDFFFSGDDDFLLIGAYKQADENLKKKSASVVKKKKDKRNKDKVKKNKKKKRKKIKASKNKSLSNQQSADISKDIAVSMPVVANDVEKNLSIKKKMSMTLDLANKELIKGNYETALFYVDEALLYEPKSLDAITLKSKILKMRRKVYEDIYKKSRQTKAELFRNKNDNFLNNVTSKELFDIEEHERLMAKLRKKRLLEEERRKNMAELRIRDSIRKKIAAQEEKKIEQLSADVDRSLFYKKFEEFSSSEKQKTLLEQRQINSFLLRAEALMEMAKYDEALEYINNVFALNPTDARAMKMREKLDAAIFARANSGNDIVDKIFKEEKEEYQEVKAKIRKQKAASLLKDAERYYDAKNWLEARKSLQKALIIEPTNRKTKRMLSKVDKKLKEYQLRLAKKDEQSDKVRNLAMSEAMQTAARAIEMQIIDEQKNKTEISEKVKVLEYEADKKLSRYSDYEGALVDLNRAMALDPSNERILKKIKKIRALQRKISKGNVDDVKKEVKNIVGVSLKDVGISSEKTKEESLAELKEKRWNEFNRSKQILSEAVRKDYKRKVKKYIAQAQKYIVANDFEKAKREVEKIYWFDKNNPTAGDLLARITELEVAYESKNKMGLMSDEFAYGLQKEKLKTDLNHQEGKEIVRKAEVAVVEDENIKVKSIGQLLREGKKLLRAKRYFEAQEKFQAVFKLDPNNKKASKYLDKVKREVLREKEKEHKKFKEDRNKEIEMKLELYLRQIKDLQRNGKYTDAAILIEKGLLLAPNNKYFNELKKINERGAKEELQRESSSADEKENLVNLAIKEFIKGNYLESKKYFEKILKLDPNDEKAKNSIIKIDEKIKKLQLVN